MSRYGCYTLFDCIDRARCERLDLCLIDVEAERLVMGGVTKGGPLEEAAHERLVERTRVKLSKQNYWARNNLLIGTALGAALAALSWKKLR